MKKRERKKKTGLIMKIEIFTVAMVMDLHNK